MKSIRSILNPLACVGTAIGLSAVMLIGCNRNGGVASVNGEPISNEEFYDYLDTKPTVMVLADGKKVELPVSETLGFQAMQDLINHKLLNQMAKDEKLEPSDKDVDEDIDFRSKLKPGFITSLKERGLSMAAIRRLVKTELCQFRLQTQGVTVTDAEVEKYVTDHKEKFVSPEAVEVYWLLARTDDKKASIDKALATGMSFKAVAKQYSDDQSAATNEGLYPYSVTTQMPVVVREPISKLSAGQTSSWVKGEQGWAKFMVARRAEAKPYDMTSERKRFVKQELMLERGVQSNDLGKRLALKLKSSSTDVADPALKELWKSYEDKLRSATTETKTPAAVTDAGK